MAALWREVQAYVQEELHAHIMPTHAAGADADAAGFYLGPDALQVGYGGGLTGVLFSFHL